MEIQYRLSDTDLAATRRHVLNRLGVYLMRRAFWRSLLAGALLGLLLLVKVGIYSQGVLALGFAAVLLLATVGVVRGWPDREARRVARQRGEYVLKMSSEGISCHAPDKRIGFYPWARICAQEITSDYLYLYLSHDTAVAMPNDGEEVQAFAAEARRLWQAHPSRSGQTLPAVPVIPETLFGKFWGSLQEAVRVILFLKFDLQSFRISWVLLALLLSLQMVLMAVFDLMEAGPVPILDWAGLGTYLAMLALLLGWAAAVSAMLSNFASFQRLLAAVSATVFAITLLLTVIALELQQLFPQKMPDMSTVVGVVGLLWLVAALVRILQRLYGKSILAALVMGSAFALFGFTLNALLPQGGLYLHASQVLPFGEAQPEKASASAPDSTEPGDAAAPAQADDSKDGPDDEAMVDDGPDDDGSGDDGVEYDELDVRQARLDVEEIYYRQPELVKQALAGIKPARRHETGLYFVGFAGDGSEREFANEVRYARDLLDRRFNTSGHSLLLLNSYDTVDETPLANAHNMDAALAGLSKRMDTQRDVLFLFLSSHGAQDHRLLVSLDPLELNDLRAEQLKQMLDKYHIRNRVIVVSACYSGGFLDVLKDDNTLILTASSRDHVAYGCGNTSRYTYFGDAYFVKALTQQDSFITAFEQAREQIEKRELRNGESPSEPQIHVGSNIVKVLKKLKVLPAAEDTRTCGLGCGKKKGGHQL